MQLQLANYKTAMWNCSDWRPVIGYEGLYEIHWRGAVRNAESKLLLKPGRSGQGYPTVSLSKEKVHRTFTLHRLNAQHHIINYEDKRCVNHKDGIKWNCHIVNLEWNTHRENNAHAFNTGLRKGRPARGIIQLDMAGNEVARYHSSEHVPPQFSGGNVCHVCNGNRTQHGGFKWRWIL